MRLTAQVHTPEVPQRGRGPGKWFEGPEESGPRITCRAGSGKRIRAPSLGQSCHGLVWMDGEPEAQRGAAFAWGHTAERPRNCLRGSEWVGGPVLLLPAVRADARGPKTPASGSSSLKWDQQPRRMRVPSGLKRGACAVFQWVLGTQQGLFCCNGAFAEFSWPELGKDRTLSWTEPGVSGAGASVWRPQRSLGGAARDGRGPHAWLRPRRSWQPCRWTGGARTCWPAPACVPSSSPSSSCASTPAGRPPSATRPGPASSPCSWASATDTLAVCP